MSEMPDSEPVAVPGLAPGLVPGAVPDEPSATVPATTIPVPPRLWNPSAAFGWSLLLSGIFGAWLHAANWRALGHPEKARANVAWAVGLSAFFLVNLGLACLPDGPLSDGLERILRPAGYTLLFAWYFSLGRVQVKHVKESLGGVYVKRGLGLPILAGVVGLAVYLGAAVGLGALTYQPSASDVAEELKPALLADWDKRPARKGATLDAVTLAPKPGAPRVFVGRVDATVHGQPQHFTIEVQRDDAQLSWTLTPLDVADATDIADADAK